MVVRSQLLLPGLARGQATESASPQHALSADVWFARSGPQGLRVGVLDGVSSDCFTPSGSATPGGLAAARLAADLFATEQQLDLPLLEDINRQVGRLRETSAMQQAFDHPQTAWVVADVHTERIDAWVGADCEIWVQTPQRWQRLCDHDMLPDATREQLQQLRERHAGVPPSQWHRIAWELLGQPSAWNSTALGLFPQLQYRQQTFTGRWQSLVLASDGAELEPDALANLPGHLERVLARPQRDDLCLLQLWC